ncbi:MAG: PLD nuclease N-terminal domain-containing protein [Dehalogenimonas sp.]
MTEADLALLKDLLPLLIPIFIIEMVLVVIALMDLYKRKRVKGESKVVWALIIIFIQLIGAIVYLVWGRHGESEEGPYDSGYKN